MLRKSLELFVCVVLLGANALGCAKPSASISGQVTLEGVPVRNGQISFQDAKGTVVSSSVKDGAYSIADAPVGSLQVSVQSFQAPPVMAPPTGPRPANAGEPPPAPQAIPDRYKTAAQSGLSFDAKAGSQVHNIDLKP